MQEKIKKIVIYIAFSAMLAVAVYAIFFNEHVIRNKYYFLATAAALMLVAAAFLVFLLSWKMERGKRTKLIIVICAVLIVFQLATLPIVNIFSQTLPAWPRGTIFQIAGFKNSISQNEVGLTMRYYLGGKTLYAKSDYPRDSHNGEIFITDEYEFVQSDYPVLKTYEAKAFYDAYEDTFETINVQENPKLAIAAFAIHILPHTDEKELVLLADEKGNWYFMTPETYKEAFGE